MIGMASTIMLPALVVRAEPKIVQQPSVKTPSSPRTCVAPTMVGSETGEQVNGACVANARCVRACGQQVGERIAAAHEPHKDLCHGDAACQQNELSLQVNTANLQEGVFAACLQRCWAPKKSGACRSDFDCVPSGPCSAALCDEGTCSQSTKYDGTRCTRAAGEVGACSLSECVSPTEYLARCGQGAALGAKASWQLTANDARRCRNGGLCDAPVQRQIANLPKGLTHDLIECVDTALTLGADPKGEHGSR